MKIKNAVLVIGQEKKVSVFCPKCKTDSELNPIGSAIVLCGIEAKYPERYKKMNKKEVKK